MNGAATRTIRSPLACVHFVDRFPCVDVRPIVPPMISHRNTFGRYKKPIEIQGTAAITNRATNKAPKCGHTRAKA
jgi:hypothetical protein